jgi:amino acid adenylation domain-containing protein
VPPTPLFQVLFAMQNYETARPAGRSLAVSDDVAMTYCSTRYDLELYTEGADDFLILYNTDLFDQGSIERMGAEFGVLLHAIAADPDAPISSYALPTPEERAPRGRPVGPGPDPAPSTTRRDPATPAEQAVAAVFTALLGVERVAAGDSFFDLGGHSLLALRLAHDLTTALGTPIAVRDVFNQPTVAGLATLAGDSAPLRPPLRAQEHPGDVRMLSAGQRQMWALHQVLGPNPVYNVPAVLRLHGPLDTDALTAAWCDVIARHDILRTIYRDGPTGPESVVLGPDVAPTRIVHETVDAPDLDVRVTAAARHPFDLTAECPVLITLLRSAIDEHVLVVTVHHIAVDEWSWRPLLRDLERAYQARTTGKHTELPRPPVQYADFATWQHDLLTDPTSPVSAARQLEFWRATLQDAPPECTFPADRPRPAAPSGAGGTVRLDIGAQLTAALHRTAREHDVTVFMLLHAALAVLLDRHGNGPDTIIGTPISTRLDPALNDAVGYFLNTLTLRVDTHPDQTLAELLTTVRTTDLDAYDHPDLPFTDVVDAIHPHRAPGRSPLFQVMLVCLTSDTTNPTPELAGLRTTTRNVTTGTTKFDATFNFHDTPDLLTGSIEYSTDLFDEATATRLAHRYRTLLESMTADPHRPISSYELLTPEERAQRAQWNDTDADLGPDRCLHHAVEAQAGTTPDSTAVIHPGGRLTHAELDSRADHLAAQLTDAGVARGELVAVVMERGWEQVVAVLAINKAGAAYLPVDAELPDRRRHELIARGECRVALTQPALLERLTWPDGLVRLPVTATSGRRPPDCPAQPDDLAYVIFTSGSTGTPKGVMIEHRAALNTCRDISRRFRVGPHDRVLALSALSFDLSVYDVYGTLGAGATLVVGDPAEDKDPAAWARIVAERGITVWNSVPALMELLIDHAEHEGTDISSLRLVMMSGDWIPPTLPDRIRALAPAAEVISLGGATEGSIWSIFHPIGHVDPSWSSIPYGRPLSNQQFHILDRGMSDVPVGVPGELYIGGAGVATGYWRDPERTAAAFVTHPRTGDRLYRTGDLGRYHPDGLIEFLGRADAQVKIRGYRVELGEIEAHLARHPDIAECVVSTTGTGNSAQLVAHVVAEPGRTPRPAQLRAHLAATLPAYMIPNWFGTLPRLPLTANGKVDRGRLSASGALPGQETERTPPRTASEQMIHAVWTDVLDRSDPGAGIGIDDDFFELGGHSLLAIKVVARLRRAAPSGTAVAVMDLFAHPTIRGLAALVDGSTTAARGLLHRLTPQPTTEPEVSYVAVPYGGGGAMVYQPLADALPATHALWSVAIPGHDIGIDEERAPLEDVAARCVQEIQEKVCGPIVLYGHCGVGSALVVEIARRLEAAGRVPEAVYIGGIFPFARPGRGLIAALGRLARHDALRSDRAYANWLTALGLDMRDIDPVQARQIVRNTRRDTEAAEEYFTGLFERSVERLRAPVISVAGEHDPASEYYQERFREWHFLSDTTAVVLLDEAGHFFQKHRAAELAEILRTTHPAIAAGGAVGDEGWRLLDVSHAGAQDTPAGPRPAVRRFLAVAAGQLVSITGSALTEFAIPIWIYLTTGSLVQFALFAVVGLVPGLLVAPLAGAVVDRSNRRTIMLAGDVGAGGTQLLLGVLLWTGNLQIWHIYPLLAGLSVALTFQRVAYNSAVPQLVPKRYLGHVNGVAQMAVGMSQLMVPIAAVGLMAVVGLEGILVLDVLSYAVAITITLLVRFPRTMAWRRKEPVTAEIKAGFRYSWGHARFRRMLIFFAALNVFLSPLFLLISPLVLAVGTLTDVGRIAFGSGLGGVLGGLVMTVWGGPPRRRMSGVLLCTLGLAVFCLVTGLRADLVTIGVGVFGMSLWLTVLNGIYATIVHVKVPQRFHGRVFALNTMIAWSTTPIGFGLVAPYGAALFEPLLAPDGALAPTVGAVIGTGPGRGIAFLYVLFAVAMAVLAVVAFRSRLPDLVDDGPDATPDDVVGLQALGRAPDGTADTVRMR